VTEPPGLEAPPDIRLTALHLDQHAAQRRGNGRQHGREEQKPRRPVQGGHVQGGRESAGHENGADDLDHAEQGEGQRQQRFIARDDLADQDADHQHAGESQIIGAPPAGAQPDGDREAAGAPQTCDQTGGSAVGDGCGDQYGHRNAGQHRRQRLEGLRTVAAFR
jgi:hypothetical protein